MTACDHMAAEDEKGEELLNEEDLEELFEKNLKKKEEPKHRGYGDYERKRIYRGPSVKRDPE
ncbi:hypothetical protein [Methanolobus psychrotolerans]|uniref:hypothetical protein n=1 Tax=Methanolobus psychrotolerans TaxID=1874706 RepID=UPI000B9166F9|nr:hypothetical protein [Methanolobus psychrotolerans]